jgi:hypothetical protein
MLLYIILLVVLVVLIQELVGKWTHTCDIREGYEGRDNPQLYTSLGVAPCAARNRLYGKWDEPRGIFTNDDDALYTNHQNILAYAAGQC